MNPARNTALPEAYAQKFRQRLLAWYDANARQLPWRKSRDPYHIWLSEIMLQQTRVTAVVEHYYEFLRRLPTVKRLAAAREQSVLAAWSGLGYYRRARMLHAAAKLIVKEFGGSFPTSAAEWQQLPGVGRYTAAAIASIALGEAIAVVDGNVERVLQRLVGRRMDGEELWRNADELLDRERPGQFNQAMMELGATVCTPRAPACLTCPVMELCATRGTMTGGVKEQRKKKEIHYALHCRDGEVFLVQRPRHARLMAGMWELPQVQPSAAHLEEKQIAHFIRGDRKTNGRLLFTLRHSITVTDYEVLVWHRSRLRNVRGKWVPTKRLDRMALTGLARKILHKGGIMRSLKPEPSPSLPQVESSKM